MWNIYGVKENARELHRKIQLKTESVYGGFLYHSFAHRILGKKRFEIAFFHGVVGYIFFFVPYFVVPYT